MIQKLFEHSEMRRILILLGVAGICAIIGAGIYVAAMQAVTPTRMGVPEDQSLQSGSARGLSS
jgi:hypothetical protein